MLTGTHMCSMFSQSHALNFMVLNLGHSATEDEMSFLLTFALLTMNFPINFCFIWQ